MKMEVPGLADSLQQCLCVNSGIYAGDVLDTDPGWQQSKLIWALSAEVGSASRMHCTGLWHVKAAQQPFFIPNSVTANARLSCRIVAVCLNVVLGCGVWVSWCLGWVWERVEGFGCGSMGIAGCGTNVEGFSEYLQHLSEQKHMQWC